MAQLDDRRIESLIRMAAEIDELEGCARDARAQDQSVLARLNHLGPTATPGARPTHPHARSAGRWWLVGSGIAAALVACASLAVWLVPRPSATQLATLPTPDGRGHVITPMNPAVAPGPALAPGPPEQCVVLAIFSDAHGGFRCVQWCPHQWQGGRRLKDVPATELLGVPFGPPCMPSAERLLVVALAGPRDRLPHTDASAEALAACIVDAPSMCHDEPSTYATAARSCLPRGVTVKVESLAMGNR